MERLRWLRRLARRLRGGRRSAPRLDHLSDELERAIAGERPDSPWHRYGAELRR